jgi:hypothetical protein
MYVPVEGGKTESSCKMVEQECVNEGTVLFGC